MSAVKDAAEQLLAALRSVAGGHVYRDPDAIVETPALVLMPPNITYDTVLTAPTGARFRVFAVEQADEQAVERLWDRVVQVGEAVDRFTDAVVLGADFSAWPLGTGASLPAYEITIESPLEVA